MKTLFETLKPELKAELDKQMEFFPLSITRIYNTLKATKYYSDLTIFIIGSIETYTSDLRYKLTSNYNILTGEGYFDEPDYG